MESVAVGTAESRHVWSERICFSDGGGNPLAGSSRGRSRAETCGLRSCSKEKPTLVQVGKRVNSSVGQRGGMAQQAGNGGGMGSTSCPCVPPPSLSVSPRSGAFALPTPALHRKGINNITRLQQRGLQPCSAACARRHVFPPPAPQDPVLTAWEPGPNLPGASSGPKAALLAVKTMQMH